MRSHIPIQSTVFGLALASSALLHGQSSTDQYQQSKAASPEMASQATSSDQSQSDQSSRQQNSRSSGEESAQQLRVNEQRLKQDVTDANKASKIIGMPVKNMKDEDLGKVSELVVDPQSAKIAYAVISSGGFMGMGDRMIAVPFQALTLRPGEKAFVIDADKNQLAQAAGFSSDNWPSINAAQQSTVGLSPTGMSSAEMQQQQKQQKERREQQHQQAGGQREERQQQQPQAQQTSPQSTPPDQQSAAERQEQP